MLVIENCNSLSELRQKLIAESVEKVAQALNKFADNLKRIEKKYAEPKESEGMR